MNNNYIKDIIQNKCCYDCENTPIIPGDIICYAFDKSVYITTVLKIDINKNDILFKSNNYTKDFLKTLDYMKINASKVLNVSKKYNIIPNENIKLVKENLINKLLHERNTKYLFGYGFLKSIDKKVIFQFVVNRTENLDLVIKNKCNFLSDIHILYKNDFIKYSSTNEITLLSYYNPIIKSKNQFFLASKTTIPNRVFIINDNTYVNLYINELYSNKELLLSFTENNKMYKQLIIDTFYNII
jgi:hypothetical protein